MSVFKLKSHLNSSYGSFGARDYRQQHQRGTGGGMKQGYGMPQQNYVNPMFAMHGTGGYGGSYGASSYPNSGGGGSNDWWGN